MTAEPPDQEEVVLVFVGGDRVASPVADLLPPDAFVIAADSGIDHALALGRLVDLAVGDFDSVSVEGLRRVEAAGALIERHAVAKDETDFEIALARAVERAPERIIVVGGHGGRVDHFLANALLLASPRFAAATAIGGTSIEAWFGSGQVHVVRDVLTWAGEPGDLVTLLAVGGSVHGVRTRGLRYSLGGADGGETLHLGSSRGVSNEQIERIVTVEVGVGIGVGVGDEAGNGVAVGGESDAGQAALLVIRPGELGPTATWPR